MILVDIANNLYRGPRPNDLRLLKDQGIKRVISLESGVYDFFHDDKFEHQSPSDFGMEAYSLRCSDFTPPQDWVIRKVLQLTCDAKPTYIHCLSGVDRTGFVCAAYRMQMNGWPFTVANAEWISLGRHPWYFWWEYKLKNWAKGK